MPKEGTPRQDVVIERDGIGPKFSASGKNFALAILVWAIWAAAVYFTVSFIYLTADFTKWSEDTRLAVCLIGGFAGIFPVAFIHSVIEDSQ